MTSDLVLSLPRGPDRGAKFETMLWQNFARFEPEDAIGDDDDSYGVVLNACAGWGNVYVRRPPYPEFCRTPDLCAGRGYCPRDPCCCD